MKHYICNTLDIREYAMDSIELLTGNRVNIDLECGTDRVKWMLMNVISNQFLDNLKIIERENSKIKRDLCRKVPAIGMRSRNVGVITKKEAIKGKAVGPIGREYG